MAEQMKPREELFKDEATIREEAEHAARDFLVRHADLISARHVDEIATRESDAAAEKYRADRLSGRANDEASSKPGMVMYVTPAEKEHLESLFTEAAADGRPVDQQGFTQVNDQLWALRMDKGVYVWGMGAFDFYNAAEADVGFWREFAFTPGAYASSAGIVRIESDGGEMWQNRYFEWDGSPLEVANLPV